MPPPLALGVKGEVTVGGTEPGSGGSTGSGWAEATAEVRRLGERAAASRVFNNTPTGGAGTSDAEPLLFGGGTDGAAGLYGRGGHPGGWDGGGRHDAVTELPRLRGLHERDYGRVAARDPTSEPPTENGGGAGDPCDAGASDDTLPPPSSIAPSPPPSASAGTADGDEEDAKNLPPAEVRRRRAARNRASAGRSRIKKKAQAAELASSYTTAKETNEELRGQLAQLQSTRRQLLAVQATLQPRGQRGGEGGGGGGGGGPGPPLTKGARHLGDAAAGVLGFDSRVDGGGGGLQPF